jgi:hypothetical protein
LSCSISLIGVLLLEAIDLESFLQQSAHNARGSSLLCIEAVEWCARIAHLWLE